MRKFLLLAGVTGVLIFSSCDKDKDKPGPGEATKVLKKIIRKEGSDETVFNLTYDAAKKLVSIKSADNTEIQTFTYDANGRVTGSVDENADVKQVFSFVYANGIPVSGTYKNFEKGLNQQDELVMELQMDYTVANNQVTRIHVNYIGEELEEDYLLGYTNGNLSEIATDGSAVTFTYGNKKPAFPKVFDFIMDIFGHTALFGVSNELLVVGGDEPATIEYTYDENGYVLTSDDGDEQLKFEYE